MTRRKHDTYFTPTFATQALRARVPSLGLGRVLECCVGDGDIARQFDDPITNDIRPEVFADRHLDVSLATCWREFPAVEWVVTNPPFNQAPLIIPLAFEAARVGIAMLLRKSFTEPCYDRQDWLADHAPHLANQIMLPRISFTGDGKTDNVACDWFVWTKQPANRCLVEWVRKA